jgi:hypothetical protein
LKDSYVDRKIYQETYAAPGAATIGVKAMLLTTEAAPKPTVETLITILASSAESVGR